MKCLDIGRIYLFLEGELSSKEEKDIRAHIARCSRCAQAVEERSFLLDASESLETMEVPKDFTQKTMALILPKKDTIWSAIIAAAIGFSSIVLGVFIYLLLIGQNPASFFIRLNQTFVSSMKTLSVWLIKSVKLVSIALKIIWQIGSFLLSGLVKLTHTMGTEFQAGLLILAVVLYMFLYFGIRKKILPGEII